MDNTILYSLGGIQPFGNFAEGALIHVTGVAACTHCCNFDVVKHHCVSIFDAIYAT